MVAVGGEEDDDDDDDDDGGVSVDPEPATEVTRRLRTREKDKRETRTTIERTHCALRIAPTH